VLPRAIPMPNVIDGTDRLIHRKIKYLKNKLTLRKRAASGRWKGGVNKVIAADYRKIEIMSRSEASVPWGHGCFAEFILSAAKNSA
jgi:hypothetical protein